MEKPELLAPVGGKPHLIAAVSNGADAVYMGGMAFNARIFADNFSDEELPDAVNYAHAHGVKVYMTINTLNLYNLLGLNWAGVEAHPAMLTVAWILFGLAYVYTAALCVAARKKPQRLLLLGGALIMLISAFGPMMHERYVFPAMLLLALAFAYDRDVRILGSLIALTATLFLNEVLVLQGGMTAANYGHLQSSEDWLNRSVSVLVMLNGLFIGWTSFDICARNHLVPLRAAQARATVSKFFGVLSAMSGMFRMRMVSGRKKSSQWSGITFSGCTLSRVSAKNVSSFFSEAFAMVPIPRKRISALMPSS